MISNDQGAKTPDKAKQSEFADVEEYAKEGKVPPKGVRYRIRIDKQKYDVDISSMTGRELLELAGKRPPERYRIDMKLRGGETRLVGLDERVAFTTPGLERFMTLPLDQTEG
jgi:hypothetical protein